MVRIIKVFKSPLNLRLGFQFQNHILGAQKCLLTFSVVRGFFNRSHGTIQIFLEDFGICIFRTPNRHKRSLNFFQQEFNRSVWTLKGTRALEFQLESLAAFGRIQGLQHGPISLRIFKGTFCISGEEQRELEPIPGSSYERSTETSYSRGKELFKNP